MHAPPRGSRSDRIAQRPRSRCRLPRWRGRPRACSERGTRAHRGRTMVSVCPDLRCVWRRTATCAARLAGPHVDAANPRDVVFRTAGLLVAWYRSICPSSFLAGVGGTRGASAPRATGDRSAERTGAGDEDTVVALAQRHQQRQVREPSRVLREVRNLPLDVELSEDHVAHRHRQRPVGAGWRSEPVVGELRVLGVVRRDDHDLLAAIARLDHEVRVRRTGGGKVRAPDDQVARVPPVTRLRHVGLVADPCGEDGGRSAYQS